MTCWLVQSSLASSLGRKPAEEPKSSGTYIQMFSSHLPIYTQLQWYFSISPKNQEIETFPHTALFILSHNKHAHWLAEVSGCLGHSFPARQGLSAPEHAFPSFFFFVSLSRPKTSLLVTLGTPTGELTCNPTPIVEHVGFIALCDKGDYMPWGIIGHLIKGFRKDLF